MNRILLAYSGGLETTVAIPWLREQFDAEVITMTVDLGQGLELASIHERALAAGAVRAHVVDARDEFVREYILPALQAGAVYEDRYPLATALGRPLDGQAPGRDRADGRRQRDRARVHRRAQRSGASRSLDSRARSRRSP